MGFDALTPFFDLITQALTGMVDGKHFFDIFNDNIIFEYPYALPDTLPRIDGRAKFMAHFSGYGDILCLDRMSDLIVNRRHDPAVAILGWTGAIPSGYSVH